jgi:hypothetical protein
MPIPSVSNSHQFCAFTLSLSSRVGIVSDAIYDLVFR